MEHSYFPVGEEAQPLLHAIQKATDFLPELYILFTLALMVALVFLRRGHRIDFVSISTSFINEGYTYSYFKANPSHKPSLGLFDINFVFQLSLAIYLHVKMSVFASIQAIHPFIILAGLAGIYILVRRALLRLLSFLLDEEIDGSYFQYTFNNSHRIVGFLLIPLHMAYFNGIKLPYSKIIFISLFLLFIWLVVRYLMMAARFRKLKSVYFFLYLCALEIMPLLLLVAWGIEVLGH